MLEHPMDRIDYICQEIERAFYTPALCNGVSASNWLFPMELIEAPDAYRLRAMLPGVEGDKISIEASEQKLSLAVDILPEPLPDAMTDEGAPRVHLREFAYGHFARSVEFAAPIDNNRIKATYKHGILTLVIPKQEAGRKKAIKIDVKED